MGLFGSKKKTTVGTVVSRVIKDDAMPNSTKTGVIKALFNDGNISDYVIEEMTGSIAVRAERMYKYGGRAYTFGLPSGEKLSASQGLPEMREVLRVMNQGQDVDIEYCHYGPPNALHIAWMKLVSEYGYQPEGNYIPVISNQIGYSAYLQDLTIILRPASVATYNSNILDQWGISPRAGYTPARKNVTAASASLYGHSPVYTQATAAYDHVQLKYCFESNIAVANEDGQGIHYEMTAQYGYRFITFLEYDMTKDYFHVKYKVNGQTKWYMYQVGSGGWPSLDAIYGKPPAVIGEYFPFIYFRFNKKSEVEDKSTNAYKTSKRMCKILNLDYDAVSEGINANPDIDDVENALLMFAVPAKSKDQLDLRYMYEYFEQQYLASADQFISPVSGAIKEALVNNGDLLTNTTIIQDKRFKMALTNQGMFRKKVIGVVANVGEYASDITTEVIDRTIYDQEGLQATAYFERNTTHKYRKQINHFMYEEISILNMQTVFFVYNEFTTIGDENDDILLVPIDRTISEQYTIPEREILYSRSLHYVFNSRVVTKVKWYQTGLFQAIVIIVSIVILIVTYGASASQFAAAVAAGTITAGAALLTVAINVIQALVTSYAFKLFVKEVGLEAAFVIAIVAALAGAYQYIASNANAGAPWVKELMTLSNGMIKGIGNTIESGINDLMKEATEFEELKKEEAKLLETAQELLESSNLLSPLVIFGEKPSEYFNRTVHSGNIGVIGLSAVSSFVDVSLRLPTLTDTLGEDFNA